MDNRSILDRLRDKIARPLIVAALKLSSEQTRNRFHAAILQARGVHVPDDIAAKANLARKVPPYEVIR